MPPLIGSILCRTVASTRHGPCPRLDRRPGAGPCSRRLRDNDAATGVPLDALAAAPHARVVDGYFPAPILNILVLHVEHVPSVAGRPFFIVICLAFFMSRRALHFMQ